MTSSGNCGSLSQQCIIGGRCQEGNKANYHDLVEVGRETGYKSELITVEVGSGGIQGNPDFDRMKQAIMAMMEL